MVSCQYSISCAAAGQSSYDRTESGNGFDKVWYGEWLTLHQVLAGNITHNISSVTTAPELETALTV